MTWVSISSVGISWSEIPGMICCLFIRSGMLVKNRSRMFDELVSVLSWFHDYLGKAIVIYDFKEAIALLSIVGRW